MEKSLVFLLKDLKITLEKIQVKNTKVTRYVKELKELIEIYSDLKIPTEYTEKYDELLKRATEINEGDNYRETKKIEILLPLSFHLYYEIRGEVKQIMNKLTYTFITSCMLFLFVALFLLIVSQVISPIVTLVLLIPIYIGIRGLYRGTKKDMLVGMSIIEFSSLTSFIAIIYMVKVIPKYGDFINVLVKVYRDMGYNITSLTVNIILIIFTLMSVMLLGTSLYCNYIYKKYKKIFL